MTEVAKGRFQREQRRFRLVLDVRIRWISDRYGSARSCHFDTLGFIIRGGWRFGAGGEPGALTVRYRQFSATT
jgi:hypothetical protein